MQVKRRSLVAKDILKSQDTQMPSKGDCGLLIAEFVLARGDMWSAQCPFKPLDPKPQFSVWV